METANKLDSLGLDYIVENSDYIFKLASALDTNNEIVKKKVFELLSALCAYSRSGYDRAIETFVYYKVSWLVGCKWALEGSAKKYSRAHCSHGMVNCKQKRERLPVSVVCSTRPNLLRVVGRASERRNEKSPKTNCTIWWDVVHYIISLFLFLLFARLFDMYAHSQNLKNERYRFNLIVGELEKTTSLEYKVAILAFLNCLIISAKTSQARIRMRNEFIGEWKICPSIITINKCHKVRLTREKWTCLCLLTNEVVL